MYAEINSSFTRSTKQVYSDANQTGQRNQENFSAMETVDAPGCFVVYHVLQAKTLMNKAHKRCTLKALGCLFLQT